MRNAANFLLFQAGWFACVLGAREGRMWLGLGVTAGLMLVHLAWVAAPRERARELCLILGLGLGGYLLDSGLMQLGLLCYPSSLEPWTLGLAPPWILALWMLFGSLRFHSLAWLAKRPLLAFVLGAVGGPLSFLGGARLGVVGVGEESLWTWVALALEYGLVTPLLLAIPRSQGQEAAL